MNVNDGPDVLEQVPAGGGVNKPTSGSYGDTANLERLGQDLRSAAAGPGGEPPPPGEPRPDGSGPGPMPAPPPGMGGGMSQPAGPVPSAIMQPSSRPDQPVFAPLTGQVSPTATASGAQRRLAMLDQLANNPEVADETREWASDVLQKLASRQA